jgi:hypothetical protein
MKQKLGACSRTRAVARGQKGSARSPHVRSIAAHAIALSGDLHERRDHRLLCGGIRVVQLQRVGPPSEVRIASVGEHATAVRALEPRVVLRLAREAIVGARDVVLRVRLHPRVIHARVIRDEIEQQPEAARAEPLAQARKRRVSSQLIVDVVSGDGEARPRDVVLAEVR